MADLTICSVYHRKETSDLLTLNRRLTQRLNQRAVLRWIAVDNTPREKNVAPPEGDVEVVPGFEISEFENIYAKPIVYPFHASSALNSVLPHCRTRFVMFLDADFFIVRPNWVAEVVAYMRRQELAAFGAPWHPQYFKKRRYYPTHNCLFVDTSRIPAMELNFHPAYPFKATHLSTNPGGEFPEKKTRGSSFLDRCVWSMKERSRVGSSRDVSYRIAQLLLESEMKVGLVQPVWKSADHPHFLNRAIDAFLPERFSVMPKRSGYFSLTGFKENGLYDFYADKMEEYMWQGDPFAVHIRNTSKRQGISDTLRMLEESLISMADRRVD